jgi:hypothetical protein
MVKRVRNILYLYTVKMSTNLLCSCGIPAQIACKCSNGLNYFCFIHLEAHMTDNPDDHIPIGLVQVRSLHDATLRNRNLKLDKIEVKLLKYEEEIKSHVSNLRSIHEGMRECIDQIFQEYYNKHQETLRDVELIRSRVDRYRIREQEEAYLMIENFKANKLEGILNSYQRISEIDVSEILRLIALKLGLDLNNSKQLQIQTYQNLVNILYDTNEKQTTQYASTNAELNQPITETSFGIFPPLVPTPKVGQNPQNQPNSPIQSSSSERNLSFSPSHIPNSSFDPPPIVRNHTPVLSLSNLTSQQSSSMPVLESSPNTPVHAKSPKILQSKPCQLSMSPNKQNVEFQAVSTDQASKCDLCTEVLGVDSIQLENCRHTLHLKCLRFFPNVRSAYNYTTKLCQVSRCNQELSKADIYKLKLYFTSCKLAAHLRTQSPLKSRGNNTAEQEVLKLLASDPLYRKCPANKCYYVIYNQRKSSILDCPLCKKSYCLFCNCIAHPGLVCQTSKNRETRHTHKSKSGNKQPTKSSYATQYPNRIKVCISCKKQASHNSFKLRVCGDRYHIECFVNYVDYQLRFCTSVKCACGKLIDREDIKQFRSN